MEELASRNQALATHVSELTNIKIELHAAYIRLENKLREIAAELEVSKATVNQLQKQVTDASTMPTDPANPVTPTDPNTPAQPVTPTDPATPAQPVTPADPTPVEPTTPVEPNGNPEQTNDAA